MKDTPEWLADLATELGKEDAKALKAAKGDALETQSLSTSVESALPRKSLDKWKKKHCRIRKGVEGRCKC